jgi:hypothetical protein
VPTLLRKSVTADGCPSAIRLLTTGFDLPALTLVTSVATFFKFDLQEQIPSPRVLSSQLPIA